MTELAPIGQQARGYVCGEPAILTFSELLLVAKLANPSNYTDRHQYCQLEEHSEGAHCAFLSTDEHALPDGSGQEWWLIWLDGTRSVEPRPGCTNLGGPEGSDRQPCLLTDAHRGAHSFDLGYRRPASGVGSGVVSASLAVLFERANVTPREICRWMTGLLQRDIQPAQLDDLSIAEALVLDQILKTALDDTESDRRKR